MIYSQCRLFLGVTLGRVSFFPLNPYGFFWNTSPLSEVFISSLAWGHSLHRSVWVWSCDIRMMLFRQGWEGKHWSYRTRRFCRGTFRQTPHHHGWSTYPCKGTSLRNQGFNSRPHKGKPMVNKQALFLGGCTFRRGRLTGHETTLEATKITWVGPERRHRGQWPNS